MKKIKVSSLESPMRLDRYLRIIAPKLTQGIIQKFLRKKLIKVNGLKNEASFKIASGDIIEFSNSLESELNPLNKEVTTSPRAIDLAKKILNKYKIYENEEFLVINKPAGIASQGGSSVKVSIDEALKYLNISQDCSDDNSQINTELSHFDVSKGYRIVHRLDKETSGIFFIAKTRNSAQKLTQAFAQHKIKKTYIAILDGELNFPEGEARIYLEKDIKNKVQKITNDKVCGEEAITKYKVLATNLNESMQSNSNNAKQDNVKSLVVFYPKTGRMHQIRVTAKYLGAPILGDKKYLLDDHQGVEENTLENDISSNRNFENNNKLMLHSLGAIIDSSIFNNEYKFEAEIPDYFNSFSEQFFNIQASDKRNFKNLVK